MAHYNSVNLKLSNSQLNKLKSATKNAIEGTLKFSSNLIGDSSDDTNFTEKLLLIDRQVSKLLQVLTNNLAACI